MSQLEDENVNERNQEYEVGDEDDEEFDLETYQKYQDCQPTISCDEYQAYQTDDTQRPARLSSTKPVVDMS